MIYTPFQIPPPISKESSSYLVLIATHCSSQSKNSIKNNNDKWNSKEKQRGGGGESFTCNNDEDEDEDEEIQSDSQFCTARELYKKKEKKKRKEKKVDFFGLTFHRKLWLLALFTNSIHRGFVVSWYFIKVLRLKLCVIVFI